MKQKPLLKKVLALFFAGIMFFSFLTGCNKKEDEGTTEESKIEVEAEVDLSGESTISLLDRGEAPAVRIGPFEISTDFIKTYLKKSIIGTGTQITALAAAYEIAAMFYAERAIADTEQKLTSERVQEIIDKQLQDFEEDREVNLLYCESIGLTAEEFMDFISIREVMSYLRLHHSESINEYLEPELQNKLEAEASSEEFDKGDLSVYYPDYMKAIIRRQEKTDLISGEIDKINEEIDVWVKEYVTA